MTNTKQLLEVHLEELGQRSWVKALFNTITGSYGGAQFRFVARPPGEGSPPDDQCVFGATFPVMRFQDLDDQHEPNAWLDLARASLSGLDNELRARGWERTNATGDHWWTRTYAR